MSKSEVELRTKELAELDKKHFFHPLTPPKLQYEQGPPIIAEKGEGIYITDVNGDRYIDGMSMLWNVNLGHGQVELAEAAKEQMSKLAFSSAFNGYSHEPVVRLAEKIASLTPGDLNVVFFTSGGSESNDTSFKLVRSYWKLKGKPEKKKIISLKRGYHGVTLGSTSATGMSEFSDFVESKAPDFLHAKAHLLNCELGDETDPEYNQSIRGVIDREGADTIAAVIMEPVMGAGGVMIPPEGYMQAVRKLCDEKDILMITDEVITGFGRTGKMFGVNNWEVVPDVMTIAKGITSGYHQLGGVVMREKIRKPFIQTNDVFFHGFTYSGHPTACAVGLKALEIIERENLLQNVNDMEQEFKAGLKMLEEKHSIVTNTRVIGLLGAFELYEDPENNKPYAPEVGAAFQVVEEAFKRKLLLRFIDWEGSNIVAIAPPLIVNKEEMKEIFEIIDESITAFKNSNI